MPAGIAISLFSAPISPAGNRVGRPVPRSTLLAALLLPLTTPRRAAKTHVPPLRLRHALGAMLRARQPLLLALMFATLQPAVFSR